MHTPTHTISDLTNYKIAVLCGGNSNEREISLLSGDGIYTALKNSSLGLNVHKIDPHVYDLTQLKADGFNLVFNTLHGRFGEDGCVQGFLEVVGIPYTGCKVLQSALTLDKRLTKQIWQANQVATSAMQAFSSDTILDHVNTIDPEAIVAELGLPLFVKPNLEGSSVGITKVKNLCELIPALTVAAKIDHTVLVEQFIDGAEYSVPILNGKALAAIQIIPPAQCEFYDYNAKYFLDETKYVCPAPLTDNQTQEILALAEKAARSVNIKSWCRVDILSDHNGKFYALEVNTNPGMTTHSLFPMAAKHTGIDYEHLCLQVLLNAINDVENQA